MPNWSIPFITNSKKGSIKHVRHRKLNFNDLWAAYPSDDVEHSDPKTGKDIMDNHCAIHVSDALYNCGIKLKAFKGVKCWSCPTPDEHGKGIHALRAQELADYLKKRPFAGCPEPIEVPATNFEEVLDGKTGIIFFKDYWPRPGQNQRTGDHIDLWNKKQLASIGLLVTFLRVGWGEYVDPYPIFETSDFHKSTQVLFWEIK